MTSRSSLVRLVAALLCFSLVSAGVPVLAQAQRAESKSHKKGEPKAETKEAPAAEAPADDAKTRATELKRQGDDAMQRIDYQHALELYTQAYELDPNPALLYNRGRALEALAHYPEALEQLEAFDRDAPPELKARVPKLGELLANVRSKVSTLQIRCNIGGARVLVRQRVVATTPLKAPLRVNAGKAVVEVEADGYNNYRKSLNLPGGGALDLDIQLLSKATSGVLVVSSPVPGAVVFVDGSRVGAVPAQAVLPAGKHQVTLRHKDYDEVDTSAVVQAGLKNEISVALEKPPPITAKWWFWTGVGVVVVGGAVVTYALLTEKKADKGDIPPGQVSGPLMRF